MQSLGPSRVSHLMRAAVVILQTCFLVDCSATLQKKLDAADGALDTTTRAVRNTDSSAHFPIQVPDRQAPETSKLLVFPDAESELPPPRSRDSDDGARTALAELVTIRADAELDVENADLLSAAKAVLGDVLHLNSRDRKVHCTVTLASVGPVPRKDLLPTFEGVLRMQSAAIVHDSPKARACSSRRPNGWNT
jgi:general secretion pathway protein D